MAALTLIISLVLIGLIIWWFFGNKTSTTVAAEQNNKQQLISVTADGGYSPQTISLKKNVPVQLTFKRKDPSSCMEEVLLPDFGIHQKLPLNKEQVVTFTPKTAGEFSYSCGMHMFFGKIIVS